jgi:lipid-A-disaccharide synthase
VKTILLSAGDLSGERHAAELVLALRERIPDARFVGMGGAAMAAAGVEISVDQRQLAVGGIFEILGSLPRVISAWRGMQRCLRDTQPDVVVLIDSGGFNLPFARRARARSDAKILYYVAPQVWAWRRGRLRKLADRTDRIAVILPFEPTFYSEHGVPVDFVGHPAVDGLASPEMGTAPLDLRNARAALGIEGDAPLLGIFPGSRRNELTRHLPIQLDAFLRLREREPTLRDLQCVVGLAPNLDREEVQRIAAGPLAAAPDAIQLVNASDGSVLDSCDVALVKPGTITVELMLRRKPMVVIGRVHPATAMIARRSLHIEWLSMPNLIAGAEIVPEFLQRAATRDRIAAALAPLFQGEARERQIEQLDRASLRLGTPGAARRTAAIVEEMLGTAPA